MNFAFRWIPVFVFSFVLFGCGKDEPKAPAGAASSVSFASSQVEAAKKIVKEDAQLTTEMSSSPSVSALHVFTSMRLASIYVRIMLFKETGHDHPKVAQLSNQTWDQFKAGKFSDLYEKSEKAYIAIINAWSPIKDQQTLLDEIDSVPKERTYSYVSNAITKSASALTAAFSSKQLFDNSVRLRELTEEMNGDSSAVRNTVRAVRIRYFAVLGALRKLAPSKADPIEEDRLKASENHRSAFHQLEVDSSSEVAAWFALIEASAGK